MQKVFTQKDYNNLLQTTKAYKKIFLVRGKKSYQLTGAEQFINQLFEQQEIIEFSDFEVNPNIKDVKKALDIIKKSHSDLIVAIGGGSVMDMAKLISILYFNNDLENTIKNSKLENEKKIPVLAIPTTSCSGAEATHFAVVYIEKTKYSLAHKNILPDYVYLSPEFSYSANQYLTATTGIDAFSQAVESVWSVNATNESMQYALQAVEIIWENLEQEVAGNKTAKNKMAEASFLAGKAINISKTTAPHAVSYAFTSYYNIPHGHAVALSLPFFFKYNFFVTNNDCNDTKGVNAVKERISKILKILNTGIDNVEEKLKNYFKRLGIETDLNVLISDLDNNLIISNINTERLKNNPRQVNKNTIGEFLNNNRKI